MTDNKDHACRPWREIARELAAEPDRKKRYELGQELNMAIEEQGMP